MLVFVCQSFKKLPCWAVVNKKRAITVFILGFFIIVRCLLYVLSYIHTKHTYIITVLQLIQEDIGILYGVVKKRIWWICVAEITLLLSDIIHIGLKKEFTIKIIIILPLHVRLSYVRNFW